MFNFNQVSVCVIFNNDEGQCRVYLFHSTFHLREFDLDAIAHFIRRLTANERAVTWNQKEIEENEREREIVVEEEWRRLSECLPVCASFMHSMLAFVVGSSCEFYP